jgi:hypothetical protein
VTRNYNNNDDDDDNNNNDNDNNDDDDNVSNNNNNSYLFSNIIILISSYFLCFSNGEGKLMQLSIKHHLFLSLISIQKILISGEIHISM